MMNQVKHGIVRPKSRLIVAALSVAFLLALTTGADAQRASYSDLALAADTLVEVLRV